MNTPEWYNQLHNLGIIGSSGMNQTDTGYERIPVSVSAEQQKAEKIVRTGYTSKGGHGTFNNDTAIPPPLWRLSDFKRGNHY